jgi:predicted Ser/Thr protein kinase
MRSTLSHIGKYDLRSVVARTGTSIVYDGWDSDIARRVAVKVVPLSSLDDSEGREALTRFKRGVQAAGQLAHPNIINIYDYGETGECAYIVMEFVDGPTLKQVLDGTERFDIKTICRIMDGILQGLQYSHDRGVVHRDMKPANIMFTKDQRLKITDFGIARLEDNNMTQTGMVIGTPAYMSPEQFMGDKIDWRSDIYSTGVVLYHMITGARPYDGNLTTIMNKVLNAPVPRPSIMSPLATPALDEIVTRAMAKKREQRFQSAAEFNAALQSVLTRPEPARRPAMGSGAKSPFLPRPAARGPYRPIPLAAAGVAVALAATAIAGTQYWGSAPWSHQDLPANAPQNPPAIDPPKQVPENIRQADARPSQPVSDPAPKPPEATTAPSVAASVDPAQGSAAGGTQMASVAPSDADRDGGGSVAPAAPSTPPLPLPQPPAADAKDQSAFSASPPPPSPRVPDTPAAVKSLPPFKQTASRPPVAHGSDQATDTARRSGPNNRTGRQDDRSLQEVLNRLHTEGPPLLSLAPQTRSDALGADNTLQPPAEYATFSTSAIGLACQTVTTATARDLGLSSPRGLWCTGVTAGSAAANAGIQSNDVLLKINGSEMRDLSRLGTIVASSAPGHTVPVEIFRNGSTRTVQLPVDQLRH